MEKKKEKKICLWRKEIEKITRDISELLLNRYFYRELQNIVTSNATINKGNHFWDSLKNNYIDSVVLVIRRQMDTDKRSRSLMNLLNDIFDNPEILTKKWFASNYSNKILNLGNGDFESHFGGGTYIDPSIVYADIGEIKHKTKKVVLYVNQAVAHTDIIFQKNHQIVVDRKTGTKFKLSFNDLDSAIDSLEKKVIKYNLLLNQSGYAGLLPIIQYDWEEIFLVPWIAKTSNR